MMKPERLQQTEILISVRSECLVCTHLNWYVCTYAVCTILSVTFGDAKNSTYRTLISIGHSTRKVFSLRLASSSTLNNRVVEILRTVIVIRFTFCQFVNLTNWQIDKICQFVNLSIQFVNLSIWQILSIVISHSWVDIRFCWNPPWSYISHTFLEHTSMSLIIHNTQRTEVDSTNT